MSHVVCVSCISLVLLCRVESNNCVHVGFVSSMCCLLHVVSSVRRCVCHHQMWLHMFALHVDAHVSSIRCCTCKFHVLLQMIALNVLRMSTPCVAAHVGAMCCCTC